MTTRNPIQIKRLYIEINFHLLYAVSGYHNKTRPIGSTETFPTDQILGRFTALKAYHLCLPRLPPIHLERSNKTQQKPILFMSASN